MNPASGEEGRMTVRWGTRLALALLWWLEFDRVVYEFMWAAVTGYVP